MRQSPDSYDDYKWPVTAIETISETGCYSNLVIISACAWVQSYRAYI